nr:MAG TPA: portal [Caudoviricetes sp.]
MNRKKKNSPKQGKIIQGGMLVPQGMRQPDIVLQMPEIFMFDMNAYMQSVKAAKGIDFSNRARLYDMYDSASLDLHLSGVIAKRMRGVTKIPIEFRRNGVPDDEINKQIKSPWFKQLRKDLVMSEFWGFTLVQFYRNDEGNIRYDLINRKHYDPIHRKLLKYQGSMDGVPIDDFPDMLFVGSERDLGIYAELLPAVLYKRGDMSDWAQFCNIFGMPVREYTYDAGDEEARRRVIDDARRQGANAAYIHPKESELKLVEAGNKTGSSDLYRTFAEYWDSKMSIRVLGNTLTTDAKSTGTQALGSVHKEEEDEMNSDDRDFILDILNYDMRPIFASLGFNVEGGEFVYAKKDKINPAQQIDIVQKLSSMGLPIDDDYLYETFCVAKPDNYKQLKEEKEAAKVAFREQLGLQVNEDDKKKQDKNTDKTAFKQHLKSFFGLAPDKGAHF